MARPSVTLSNNARRARNSADEFWRTPADGTAAFMMAEAERLRDLGGAVWECACGDGAMARVIEAFGFEVTATNLTARGYGRTGVDFLKARKGRARIIVTNPPFSRAAEFIRHWAKLGLDYLALLLPRRAARSSVSCRRRESCRSGSGWTSKNAARRRWNAAGSFGNAATVRCRITGRCCCAREEERGHEGHEDAGLPRSL